jgi:hypothetical protein
LLAPITFDEVGVRISSVKLSTFGGLYQRWVFKHGLTCLTYRYGSAYCAKFSDICRDISGNLLSKLGRTRQIYLDCKVFFRGCLAQNAKIGTELEAQMMNNLKIWILKI